MRIEIMRYPELGCDACYEIHEFFVEIKTYKHVGLTSNSEPMFESGSHHTANLAEADVWFEMTVKWDGCANWIISDQRNGMMSHVCEYSEFNQFNDVIKQVYREAHGYMETSDVDTFKED